MEASIVEIENQNDILQTKVQQNETSLATAGYQIELLTKENEQLKEQIRRCRDTIQERDTSLANIKHTQIGLVSSNNTIISENIGQEIDENCIQLNQLKCKIVTLEKCLVEKEKENCNLLQQLSEIKRKDILYHEELNSKNNRIEYLEKEEYRLVISNHL